MNIAAKEGNSGQVGTLATSLILRDPLLVQETYLVSTHANFLRVDCYTVSVRRRKCPAIALLPFTSPYLYTECY